MIPTMGPRQSRLAVIRLTASRVPMISEKVMANVAAVSVLTAAWPISPHTSGNSSVEGSNRGAHLSASNWPLSARRRAAR